MPSIPLLVLVYRCFITNLYDLLFLFLFLLLPMYPSGDS